VANPNIFTEIERDNLAINTESLDEMIANLSPKRSLLSGYYLQRKQTFNNALNSSANEAISRRLSKYNLSVSDVINYLSDCKPSEEQKLWVEKLEFIIYKVKNVQYSPQDEELFTHLNTDAMQIPFFKIFEPLLRYAKKSFCESLANKNMSPSLISRRAHEKILLHLGQRLADRLSFTLFQSFANYKDCKEDFVPHIQGGIYKSFTEEFWGGLDKQFFLNYPIAGRILVRTIDTSLSYYNEIFTNLLFDIKHINSICNCGTQVDVVDINLGLSDPHNGSKSVCILELSGGKKIVYKPRSLQPELEVRSFLQVLRDNGSPPIFTIMESKDLGDHGWQSYIEPSDCIALQELQDYYECVGASMFLLRVFSSSDIHQENLMPHREQMIVLDFETAIQAPFSWDTGHPPAVSKAFKQLFETVYRAHILPVTIRTASDGLMRMGGLCEDIQESEEEWGFLNKNTDEMQFGVVSLPKNSIQNLPKLNGRTQPGSKFVPEIISGFRKMVAFAKNNSTLFSNFTFSNNCNFRQILRPTETYLAILHLLKDPRNQINGLAWSSRVEFKYIFATPENSVLDDPSLLAAERKALLLFDVPYFIVSYKKRALYSEKKVVVTRFLDTTPQQCLKKNIGKISRELYSIDERIIRLALIGSKHEHAQNNLNRTSNNTELAIWTSNKAKSELRRIFNILLHNCIRTKGTATYYSIKAIGLEGSEIGPLSYGMYSGLMGIAVFSGLYSKYENSSSAAKLTNEFLSTILHSLSNKDTPHPRPPDLLGLDGLGGILYGASVLASELPNSPALEIAHKAAAAITNELIESSTTECLIWGLAGGILGLVRYYKQTSSISALEKIYHLTDIIIERSELHSITHPPDKNRKVIIGMAHGLCGIALALHSVYQLTNSKKANDAVVQIESILARSWSPTYKEWPKVYGGDFLATNFVSRWCHGSIGISSFLNKRNHNLDDKSLLKCAEISLSKQDNNGISFICCGDFGFVDLLINSSFLNLDALKKAQILVAKQISMAQKKGSYSYEAHGDQENITLFRGCSGVGYEMLRTLHPNLPSISIME